MARDVRQAPPLRSVRVHNADLLVVHANVGHEGNLLSVGGPGGFYRNADAQNLLNQRSAEGALLGAVGVHHGEVGPLAVVGGVSDRSPSGNQLGQLPSVSRVRSEPSASITQIDGSAPTSVA